MTPTETTTILRQFNEWLRSDRYDMAAPTTREMGQALDAAVEMIDRLEDAESDPLEQARLDGMGSEREAALMAKLEAAEKERDALRAELSKQQALTDAAQHIAGVAQSRANQLQAKIEAMERQESARLVTPTAYRWRYRGAIKWQYGELTEEGARLAKEHNHEVQPLYAIPGAQTQGEGK